jgi:hypothetical protein
MADTKTKDSPKKTKLSENGNQAGTDPTNPPNVELGKEHEMFAKNCGKWIADCSFFYQGKEDKNTATVTREMILGGRFLKEIFTTDMGGFKFEGEMLLGASEGKYQGIWIDNMSNRIFYSTGKLVDGTEDTVELITEPTKDFHSGKMKTMRQIHKFISDKEFLFEAFDTFLDEGVERMSMKMIYRRA